MQVRTVINTHAIENQSQDDEPDDDMSPLMDYELRFVEHYLIEVNKQSAAVAAGLRREDGSRLLKRGAVAAEIARRQAERSMRLNISADRVTEEFACVAFVDPLDYVGENGLPKPLHQIRPHARRAIKKIKQTIQGIEFEFHDKPAALTALTKQLGLEKAPAPQEHKHYVVAIPMPTNSEEEWERAMRADLLRIQQEQESQCPSQPTSTSPSTDQQDC